MVSEAESLKKKEVKKHVATIQCSNSFSLLQRKISNALLFHAYLNLKTVEEHHITVKQLCHSIGYQGNNHSVIKQALKGLIATVIEWDIVDHNTGKEDWTASSILASVHIKGSDCFYAYSPPMRELLYTPSMYAKINLVVQSKFKSAYGLALYENCVRYQELPYTKWFKLEIFKKLMGVPDENYQMFRDFKRRVLDKAVEEVNTYSDLFVQPEIERAGHKVIRIRFKISAKEKKKWIGVSLIEKGGVGEQDQLLESLTQTLTRQFFLDQQKSKALVKKHGVEFIKNKIKFVESSKSYINGNVNNISGFLLEAIKNDYKPHKSIHDDNQWKHEVTMLQSTISHCEKILDNHKDPIKETDDEAWQHCLASLKNDIPQQDFDTWIKPLQAKFDGTAWVLFAPNHFVKDKVKENFLSKIQGFLGNIIIEVGHGEETQAIQEKLNEAKAKLKKLYQKREELIGKGG